jgi:transglutaminase-like putative cysteine protease
VAPVPAWVERLPDKDLTAPGKALEAGESDFPLVDHQVRLSAVTAHYERYVERLVSESDVESAAQISIEIDPEHETVLLHQVRVFRGGKFLDKLASARRSLLNRESRLEDGLIDGRVTLHVLLQDVRVGDLVDYSYTTERRDPISERGYYDWFRTQWGAAVRYFRLRVLYPDTRTLYFLDHGAVGTPVNVRKDGWTETRWEARDIATLQNDSGRPAWHFRYPRIEISEFGSWNAVRDWALPMYVIAKPPAGELAAKIDELRQEPNEARRILLALRFVQDDIRYTGIEVGAGAWRPSQPDKVLARRYGDCKDKTLLLVSMLRALDVQAWPALVHSSTGPGLLAKQPSPGAFNHAIAKVSSGGRNYWLDPTISGQGGQLDTMVQADYGPALVVAAESDGLDQIPPRDGATPASYVVETFDFRKGTNHTALFSVKTLYREEEADDMRVQMRSQTVAKLSREYLDYYRKSYDGIRMVKPLTVSDDRERNQFTIEETYEIDEPFEKDEDGNRTFNFEAFLITEETRTPEQTVRTSPLARSFPKHVRHEIVAWLPGEWNIEGDGVTLRDPAFEYRSKVKYHGGKLELAYDLRNMSDHVPVSDLKRFLSRLDKAHDDAYYTLTDNDTPAAASTVTLLRPKARTTGPSLEMLVAAGLGLGFGLLALFELRRSQWRLPPAEPDAPAGLGGWLLLPLIGVCLAPFGALFMVWKFFLNIGGAAAFSKLEESMQYVLLLEFVFVCVMLVLSVYCVWALFRRDRRFPYAFIFLVVTSIAVIGTDVIGLHMADDRAQLRISQLSLVLQTFSGGILIAYMLMSRRARATFVTGDGEEYRSRGVPRQPVPSATPMNQP